MRIFGRKRYRQRQAERYAEHLAEEYRWAFELGRGICRMEWDCPADRPQFITSTEDARVAGLFDGWVAEQCEIFDESDEGIRAIEEFLVHGGDE